MIAIILPSRGIQYTSQCSDICALRPTLDNHDHRLLSQLLLHYKTFKEIATLTDEKNGNVIPQHPIQPTGSIRLIILTFLTAPKLKSQIDTDIRAHDKSKGNIV